MRKYLIILSLLLAPTVTYAGLFDWISGLFEPTPQLGDVRVFRPSQGGTGTSSTPTDNQILLGDGTQYGVKTLTAGTNITFGETGNTLTINSSGGSGGGNPNLIYRTLGTTKYYTASSSLTDNNIWNFNNGFISAASSSIGGALWIEGSLNGSSTAHIDGNTLIKGKIGINTYPSNAALEIANGGNAILAKAAGSIQIQTQETGSNVQSTLYSDNTPSVGFGSVTNHPLFIRTNNMTRLTVDSSGNFGVGSTTPARLFSVDGDSIITGQLKVGPIVGTSTIQIRGLTNCNTIDSDSSGNFSCGTDETGGTSIPNLIYRTLSATKYYTASSSATDALGWHFANGFVSSGASSTISDTLQLTGTATSTVSGGWYVSANSGIRAANLVVDGIARILETLYAQAGLIVSSFLQLPLNGTIDNQGEITMDTTTGQIRSFDGTNTNVLIDEFDKSFWVASTTPDNRGKYFASSTTTWEVWHPYRGMTLDRFYCKTDVGNVTVEFGDGTASTTAAHCTSSGVEKSSLSNNTFTSREDVMIGIGSSLTSPNKVTISSTWKEAAD